MSSTSSSSFAARNYYELLNAQPNATLDNLKSNYKQLILQCHPDKLQQDKQRTTVALASFSVSDCAAVSADDPNAESEDSKFVAITEAWNTLKDPAKRKLYDAELLLTKFQMHSNIFERLQLADMQREAEVEEDEDEAVEGEREEGTTFYTYNCRCGGQYVVDESAYNAEIINRSSYGGDGDGCGAAAEVIVECSECSLVIILNG